MPEDNNSIEPVSLEQFGEEISVDDSAEYKVNFPVEDGEDPEMVEGTGASFSEAVEEAKQKAISRREERGLVE